MNKRVLYYIGTVLMLTILCTACTLAQPEAETENGGKDRYVGIYAVLEEDARGVSEELIGQYSEEENTYIFPGLEGHALFVARKGQGDDSYMSSCIDMGDASVAYHTVETETEHYTNYEISGTLYVTREDTYWRLFNVYQKADGTIYLNGTGDCIGSFGTVTLEEKATRTVNGQNIDMGTTKVSVTIETAKIADAAVLYWYDSEGELLFKESPDLLAVTELSWYPGAIRLILEERFGEEVSGTLYEQGTEENPTILKIMTLGDDGMGEIKDIPVK